MTVLVTGAGGFLGRCVIDVLLARGEQPRALVHSGAGARALTETGVDVYSCDLGNRPVSSEALRGVDRVIHCAARTGPWGPDDEYQRANVTGLEALVRAALAAGVRRFVHVSSITVHGNDVRGEADEDAPLRAEPNPYSRSKVAGERLLARMIREQRAPVTIVRPGWIYGPRDSSSFARIARRVEDGQMITLGSGANHVPLIYVRDAAEGILLAGESPEAEGRSYLLVNDEPVTQRQFIDAVAGELGAPAPTRSLPYGLALMLGAIAEAKGRLVRSQEPPPVTRYGVQLLGGENRFVIGRARRELGFSPQVSVTEGVRRSVAWYRSATGRNGGAQ
ncbi:MAG TPA: NAD-dependent epimerase/dehydratase family protein [Thermoleophilaceae bacterium]|nr:NAD-dependent epimerase/dehydratase family protein [Thermoleophilaceae bacterium]